ncbi:MAG TPA: tetratricopeptide repeat protein [Pirellulales bacterium]|jgi:tetratricopeptide (TPR) repeat protein|nr:tetratricopeptide repeat protein [Pirellulales bacterium]
MFHRPGQARQMIEFAASIPRVVRARLLARRANQCLARRDFVGAAKEFTRALELQPTWAAAYCHRSHAWISLEQHQEAIGDCTAALSYDPRCAMAFNNRAVAYAALGRFVEASADLDRAVQQAPKDAQYLANRGAVRQRVGNLAGAIDDLQKVLRWSPAHVQARVELATIYESLGKDHLALEHLDQAIQLNFADATTYQLRANIYARRGRPAAAVRDLNRTLLFGISPAIGLLGRANMLHLLGHDEAAIRDLDESIRLSTTFEAFFIRSEIYLARGETAKAVADGEKALRLLGEDTTKYDLRGLAYLLARDFQRALADFERMIESEPECGVNYNNRGYAWHRLGNFERAIADYESAIRLQPEHPNAYKNLAVLRANCVQRTYRDGAKAIAAARRALELGGPKPREWLTVVANAYAEAGDFVAAEEWLRKAADPPPAVAAPPLAASGPFQFSLGETLLVLTVLAVLLTATRWLRASELWFRLALEADLTIGLMAIPAFFLGARHCWRQIRLRSVGERAFYLGAACGAPVGMFEGLLFMARYATETSVAPAPGFDWSFLILQVPASTFASTCAYSALGGIIAVGLDHAIKRFRGVSEFKPVATD